MSVEERMRALGAEITEAQTELAILEEQIVFQADVSEDARIRSLVSGTPLADREAHEAGRDLERMVRARDELRARLETLRAQQDAILERMLDDRR